MKIDSRQLRFCKTIGCEQLKGADCLVQECLHSDMAKAIEELRAQLKAVKDAK